jgi:hypothetical protein
MPLKHTVLVTRKLPKAIGNRLAENYTVRLNEADHPYSSKDTIASLYASLPKLGVLARWFKRYWQSEHPPIPSNRGSRGILIISSSFVSQPD